MLNEDPIRNNCLQPQSLVMTYSKCFYCHADEGEKCYTIWNNFGIKSCNFHYDISVRDCKAYMYKNGLINIDDIYKIPYHKAFFDMLSDEFSVKRSSGQIDNGWIINIGYFGSSEFIKYDKDKNLWTIPIKKKYNNGFCTKQIPMNDLLIPEIIEKLPINFKEEVIKLIGLLNTGLYKEENDAYDLNVDHNKPTQLLEDNINCIYTCIDSAGRVGRVLIPPS